MEQSNYGIVVIGAIGNSGKGNRKWKMQNLMLGD